MASSFLFRRVTSKFHFFQIFKSRQFSLAQVSMELNSIPCQISIAAANQLHQLRPPVSSFHIAAANLKKLQIHAIIYA